MQVIPLSQFIKISAALIDLHQIQMGAEPIQGIFLLLFIHSTAEKQGHTLRMICACLCLFMNE